MSDYNIELKPKKKSVLDKIKALFEDKKKRYLYLALFIMPFFIGMCVFGYITYKEAKNLINIATGETEVKKENVIERMNYVLREDATDIQKQYFAQLKQAIEVDNASDEICAGLICKNYVADLYTWTNKQGSFDVSALYYVYTPQKQVIYTQARDSFYKYMNNYINEYGKNNLPEVDNVEVVKSAFTGSSYETAAGETFEDAIYVTCNWTYKPYSKFSTSNLGKSMNFMVVIREGRYEIVEASESAIEYKVEEVNDGTISE